MAKGDRNGVGLERKGVRERMVKGWSGWAGEGGRRSVKGKVKEL